jgi:hypothetical protein
VPEEDALGVLAATGALVAAGVLAAVVVESVVDTAVAEVVAPGIVFAATTANPAMARVAMPPMPSVSRRRRPSARSRA